MLKQTVLGTAVLAVALAMVPTTAHAQQPYYGAPYNNGYGYQDNYAYEGQYARDRYLDHEGREQRERWARIREMRERERSERARHYYEEHSRYRGGYRDDYGYRR